MCHTQLDEVSLFLCLTCSWTLDFADVSLVLPREGDQWLMQLLEAAGFNQDELKRLNRVRIYQQVRFSHAYWEPLARLSTRDTSGVVQRPNAGQRLTSQRRAPLQKYFCLWERALKQLVPAGGIMD